MIYLHGYFYILTGENPDGSGTPSWNWNFGLKISASGYWISASRVLWDIGFRLPGFFEILDDRISLFDFWVNFFHFIQFIQHAIQLGDPELVIWVSKVQDAIGFLFRRFKMPI
ncbi:unnamed protein product [Rhizophagus irregularis]|nr:unnamed protein product [Rhizophagus irregularis]